MGSTHGVYSYYEIKLLFTKLWLVDENCTYFYHISMQVYVEIHLRILMPFSESCLTLTKVVVFFSEFEQKLRILKKFGEIWRNLEKSRPRSESSRPKLITTSTPGSRSRSSSYIFWVWQWFENGHFFKILVVWNNVLFCKPKA